MLTHDTEYKLIIEQFNIVVPNKLKGFQGNLTYILNLNGEWKFQIKSFMDLFQRNTDHTIWRL